MRSQDFIAKVKLMKIAKIFQLIVDLLRGKKHFQINIYDDFWKLNDKMIKKSVERLKSKIAQNEKIKVYFFVIYDSCFPAAPVFETMLNDNIFEPYVVVIPDVSRGYKNMFYQLDKTFDTLSSKYANINIGGGGYKSYLLHSFDKIQSNFIDFSHDIDIVCSANPYDEMTHSLYGIKTLTPKGVLSFFISYGFMPDYYSRKHIINRLELNLCWKVFVDTPYNLNESKYYTEIKGKNAILTGYAKMDTLAHVKSTKRERKKIIIAPHHTIYNNFIELPLSNFLIYADFFLKLYDKYPQIDFVFRPHPLLVVALAKDEYWGQEKLDNYLAKLKEFNNVEYQEGGEYFETFINSDGIIHDCSSFICEYLYTDNPCCYMLKSQKQISEVFHKLGQECLKHYYQAFNQNDIIEFIENAVLKGQDTKKEERIKFAKENIRINYPNVSQKIIENLKADLQ